MTSFAPPKEVRCPWCHGAGLWSPLASLAMTTVQLWSDGCETICGAPVPSEPWLCPHCARLVWGDDLLVTPERPVVGVAAGPRSVVVRSFGPTPQRAALTLRITAGYTLQEIRAMLSTPLPQRIFAGTPGGADLIVAHLSDAGAMAIVETSPEDGQPTDLSLPLFTAASNTDCLALNADTCPPRRARLLRLRQWWAVNDNDRDANGPRIPSWRGTTGERLAQRVIDLLPDPRDHLFRAEALRELGDHRAAIREVAGASSPLARQIVALARRGESAVAPIVDVPTRPLAG
jgi:hypothetical protein